jgi:XrtN system VIT domain protein
METRFKKHDLQTKSAPPVRQDASFHNSLRAQLLEFDNYTFRLGAILLILSGALFWGYDLLAERGRNGDGGVLFIIIHYGIAASFSIGLLSNGAFKYSRETYKSNRPARWLGLLLWLISAYALNREVPVFQRSTEWLCWILVIVGMAMAIFAWKEAFSVRMQQVLYAALAAGWWLFVYMALYISPLYAISVPLLIGLGLSIHTFIPLAFVIALGKRLWFDTKREEHLKAGVIVGLSVPVLVLGLFLMKWGHTINHITESRQLATVRKTTDLPDWVLIAQRLKPGWITNRLLLSNRLYDQGPFNSGISFGIPKMTALDDVREHDPLILIASRLFPADVVSDEERLSILKLLSGERHGTEKKFWTGRHLTTEEVISQVRIWPQFRISYTEQTIRIRNQARTTTEEALLSFHLPAGSVVSSMSLWVNGKEEPARLTTVAKADSAYRTIVGVESRIIARDPSVVYWQEGNRVTVRVFPCRAGEDRRVKLGITSPLSLVNKQLVYQNPYFEGPTAQSAKEFVTIQFDSTPTNLQSPWLFNDLDENTLTHRGNYEPDWRLTLDTPALSTEAFVLDNHAYRVASYQPVDETFTPTNIYLDVNASWQKAEFMTAYWAATKQPHCRVWIFDDGLKQLTEKDLDATYERLSQQPFSLFPIYRIANPATALLITKGNTPSPILADLKGSIFTERFGLLSKQIAPIRTFCYESASGVSSLPDYLKTLAELRILNVTQGDTSQLINLIQKTHQFPRPSDTPNQIALPEAGIAIQETSAGPMRASIAPDHLARLFMYNQLLRQIGRQFFSNNYQTDTLIQQAQRAHIVSPLSSLVVLETEADYKRFDIKKDKSGLDNATLKEEGAVPEPHEWAMLIMLGGLIGWIIWKKRYAIS